MTISSKLLIVGLWGSVALSSCAYPPQVIRLNPALSKDQTASEANAAGHEVVLVTRDGRSSPEIGRRASGSRGEAAITTDSNIAAVLKTQMTDILNAKGYRVLSEGSEALPTLDVQLKELSYTAFDAAGEHKVKIQAVIETFVKNGSQSFRTTFQAKQERRIIFEPIAKSNEEWINETFADVFKEVASDTRLYSHLN